MKNFKVGDIGVTRDMYPYEILGVDGHAMRVKVGGFAFTYRMNGQHESVTDTDIKYPSDLMPPTVRASSMPLQETLDAYVAACSAFEAATAKLEECKAAIERARDAVRAAI